MRAAPSFPENRDRPPATPAAALGTELGQIADRYTGQAGLTAGAGELATVQIFNPPDSMRTIVIDEVDVASSAAFVHEIRVTSEIATTLAGRWRSNTGGHELGSGELRTDIPAAAVGSKIGEGRTVSNAPYQHTALGIVLRPGRGLSVVAATAAAILSATFHGRELAR